MCPCRFSSQVDLSEQHSLHLVIGKPVQQSSGLDGTPAHPPNPSAGLAGGVSPRSRQPTNNDINSSNGAAGASLASDVPGAAGARQPERMELDAQQMARLQWQYRQALVENQQQHSFAVWQSMARAQHQALSFGRPLPQEEQNPWHPSSSEVAVSAATRALGGNMPGPAGGGAVRDITDGPPEGLIPAAGLGGDGAEGRGNLADPAPAAAGRGTHSWTTLVLKVLALVVVFGIDAAGWQLTLLTVAGVVTFMFKTGVLENVLGGQREGGGLWKVLCTAANVVTEGGGFVMDVRFFCSTFFFSVFPA